MTPHHSLNPSQYSHQFALLAPSNSLTQTSQPKVESLDGELKDAFADLLSLHPPEEGSVAEINGGANGDVGSLG